MMTPMGRGAQQRSATATAALAANQQRRAMPPQAMAARPMVKPMAKGGAVTRGDGCCIKGRTRCKM